MSIFQGLHQQHYNTYSVYNNIKVQIYFSEMLCEPSLVVQLFCSSLLPASLLFLALLVEIRLPLLIILSFFCIASYISSGQTIDFISASWMRGCFAVYRPWSFQQQKNPYKHEDLCQCYLHGAICVLLQRCDVDIIMSDVGCCRPHVLLSRWNYDVYISMSRFSFLSELFSSQQFVLVKLCVLLMYDNKINIIDNNR